MYLARSSPTVLTWFMDASWSDLQHHHSGMQLPSGASTPSGPPQLVRSMVATIRGSEQPDLDWDIKLVRSCPNQACVRQILLGQRERKPRDAVPLPGHGHQRGGE